MLQGNPYEAERWVHERAQTVRQGVAQLRLPRTVRDVNRLHAWRVPGRTPARWPVQGWWVLAVFALGTLLGLAFG